MRVSRDCWKCEYQDCGHVWLAAKDEPPNQCSKCLRRKWHTPGSVEILQVGQMVRPRTRTDAVSTGKGRVTIAAYERPVHAPGCPCFVCGGKRKK